MFNIHRHTYVAETLTADRRRDFELDARNSRLVRLARRARKLGSNPTDAQYASPTPADRQPGAVDAAGDAPCCRAA